MKVKIFPDRLKNDKSKMVDIENIPGYIKVKDLIKFLKKANPEAVCLLEYDGYISNISLPKKVLVKSINVYSGSSSFFCHTDEDLGVLEVDERETAILFD